LSLILVFRRHPLDDFAQLLRPSDRAIIAHLTAQFTPPTGLVTRAKAFFKSRLTTFCFTQKLHV
jgi:hypothetical protein